MRLLFILFILFVQGVSTTAFSQTRLGLHYTKEEISIWKQRATSGPYRKAGDVAANTPGDWDRIVRNKNYFVGNTKASLWIGPPGTGCVAIDNNQVEGTDVPAKRLVGYMQDAAFYALLFNDLSIKNMVKKQLLLQASLSGVNFYNTSRWCGKINDNSPNFEIAIWGVTLLYTYDYVKDAFTTTEKQVFIKWLTGLANYLQKELNYPLDRLFENRGAEKIEDYVYIGSTVKGVRVYAGGYQTTTLQQHYNNRRAHMMQFVGLMGIVNNNTTFIKSAKNFIREAIAFMCYPNGAFAELNRGTKTLPSRGLNYLSNTFGSMIMVADALARTGDFSMYNFKTTHGHGETKGTTVKSLEWIITQHGKYLDGQKKVYEESMTIGDPAAKIDGQHSGWVMMSDAVNFAIANIYYKNDYNKKVYMRTAPGIYSYPSLSSVGSNGSLPPWSGLVGHTAGLFMYAQMEGKVWPYPSSTTAQFLEITNSAPVVSAGADKTVTLPLASLSIYGNATDNDGTISSYKWTKVSGPTVTMSNTTTKTLSLTNLVSGTFVFRLTATDNSANAEYDDVKVIVNSASTATFYRAVNLNGSSMVIDGKTWQSSSTSNFSFAGKAYSNQTIALNPSTDSNRSTMIRSSIWKGTSDRVSVTLSAVPSGTYTVYVYVWEDNYSTTYDLILEGRKIGTYSSGTKGSWKRISLGTTTITDGTIVVTALGGEPCLSGIEVWKSSATARLVANEEHTEISEETAVGLPYPNPFVDQISLKLTEEESSAAEVKWSIADFSGQVIKSSNSIKTIEEGILVINDLETVPSGTYILKVYSDKSQRRLKIIKR